MVHPVRGWGTYILLSYWALRLIRRTNTNFIKYPEYILLFPKVDIYLHLQCCPHSLRLQLIVTFIARLYYFQFSIMDPWIVFNRSTIWAIRHCENSKILDKSASHLFPVLVVPQLNLEMFKLQVMHGVHVAVEGHVKLGDCQALATKLGHLLKKNFDLSTKRLMCVK